MQEIQTTGSGELFTGDGTAYSEAVADGTGFACSYRYLNDWNKGAWNRDIARDVQERPWVAP